MATKIAPGRVTVTLKIRSDTIQIEMGGAQMGKPAALDLYRIAISGKNEAPDIIRGLVDFVQEMLDEKGSNAKPEAVEVAQKYLEARKDDANV